MVFIRPYRPSDEDAVIHIFRETAHAELQEAGDLALHYASYNWARPYIMLVPDYCLVLDDDKGTAVGYLLGVPDTKAFVTDYRARYLPHLEFQGITEPPPLPPKDKATGDQTQPEDMATAMRRFTWRPESMLAENFPKLLPQYPAHLHIDILPAYQSQGWGKKLVEQMLEKFSAQGVLGIHLGKVGTNFGAGRFYARLGFERFPEVMDGGKSGEIGRVSDGGVYLVKML